MEHLVFRCAELSEQHSSVEWVIVDDQGQIKAPVKTGRLEDIARQLSHSDTKRQAICLFMSHTYAAFHVALPPKLSQANAKTAAPYALEETLADSIEHYHFAFGQYQKTDDHTYLSVIAINRQLLQDILNHFQAHNVSIKYAFPETALLPSYQTGVQKIYIENQTCHTRRDDTLLYSLPVDLLASLIDEADAETVEIISPEKLNIEAILSNNTAHNNLTVKHYGGNLLPLYAKELSQQKAVNLLQGEFTQQPAFTQHIKKWALPSGIAALLAVVALGSELLTQHQLEKKISALEDQKIAIFKQAFPDSRRFHRVRQRMEQALNASQTESESSDFLPLLQEYVNASQSSTQTTINAIEYNRDRLSFTLNAQDIQDLDKIKVSLEKDQRVVANIASSKTIATGIEATLNLEKP